MLTDAQRERRAQGIGASDSPIIMGYSTYKTPYQLYLEKTGNISADDNFTEAQYWGNALEPLILKRFAEENKVELTTPDTICHPDYHFIFANLDAWCPKLQAVVECKAANAYSRKEWDMSLSDGIPMAYIIQIAKQCMLTDALRGYCAVLIGGMEYKQFIYERDKALEELILKSDIAFWKCVQERIEPAPVNTSDCRLKYGKASPEKVAHSNFTTTNSLKSLAKVKRMQKQLDEDEELYKVEIMAHMKDAEFLVGLDDELLASWRPTKKGNRVFNLKGI